MPKPESLRSLLRRNGNPEIKPGLPAPSLDLPRIAQLFGPLALSPEQLRQFPLVEGSDEEPWDVLLGMLAMDEHQALELLAKRTGLKYMPEPRHQESASRFYELVPPDVARSR